MQRLLLTFSFLLFLIPLQSQWTQLNNAPFSDHHTNGFGADGKGYIVEGIPDGSQNNMWEYDPITDEWTSLGLIPGPGREFSIGDDMDGKYYFGFGIDRNDLWEFDPVTKSYKELASCPCSPRWHPAFVAHNGKIYMGAGSSNSGDLNDWWIYDFATDEWTQKTNIPGGRRHHTFQFGIDDAIYVGGGHVDNWIKYDITADEWSTINDFPAGRVAGTQFSYGGRGFTLSGDTREHDPLESDQFLLYEPSEDEWYKLPFAETQHRWAPSSFIIDDELYYFGGRGDFGNNFRMWKFDLSTTTCLAPRNAYSPSSTETSAELLWSKSPDGNVDTLQWRVKGDSEWNFELDPSSGFILEDLASCTEYEFRVKASCGSVYSEIADFRTAGCGSCTDFDFCDVTDDFRSLNLHISRVKLDDFENKSGADQYSEYTASDQVQVPAGQSFDVEIDPEFTGSIRRAGCKAWIDFDGNGEFEDNEIVIDEFGFDATLLQNVAIPLNAKEGIVRMRIILELSPLFGPCQGTVISDGEVEDYCLTILENTSDLDKIGEFAAMRIFPNPNEGVFNLEYSIGEQYQIFDAAGRLVSAGDLNPVIGEKTIQKIQTEDLESGLYLVKVISGEKVGAVSFIKK